MGPLTFSVHYFSVSSSSELLRHSPDFVTSDPSFGFSMIYGTLGLGEAFNLPLKCGDKPASDLPVGERWPSVLALHSRLCDLHWGGQEGAGWRWRWRR